MSSKKEQNESDKKDIVITNASDWKLIFDELKNQWGKRGPIIQSVFLTKDDFVQLQYRISMKLNTKQKMVEGEETAFQDYLEAMKYVVSATIMLENLRRANKYLTKTIGIFNPMEVVEVFMDEKEYEEYCDLMEIEADFLGRKNI